VTLETECYMKNHMKMSVNTQLPKWETLPVGWNFQL